MFLRKQYSSQQSRNLARKAVTFVDVAVTTNKKKNETNWLRYTEWMPHSAIRLRGDVLTTSLCTSQQRRRFVPNKTPNDVSLECRQGVSVVRLHDVLLEHRDDVLKGPNNDVPSVSLHDVSNKSQMKHPTMSQRYITKTSQWCISTMSHYYVPTRSPVSPKWNT